MKTTRVLPCSRAEHNITDALANDGGRVSFAALCETFGKTDEGAATAGEVCEALALAYVCRQAVPEAGGWRASLADSGARVCR